MTTTVPQLQLQGSAAPDEIEVIRVSVPARSLASELRAIRIVWRRDMIRYLSDRLRMVTSLIQPFLFLFILGSGLQKLASSGTHGVALHTFIYPGILCMAVMYTAIFSTASFVWDREFGFLREMMVAPVRRSSIILGKALGGASIASIQGLIMLCFAGAVGVPYKPLLILGVFGIQLVLAFTITSMGLMIAIRIKQMQSFMGLMQMIVLPLFFISGALFPVSGLPTWLSVLNRLDPMAYAVDPMRRLVFSNLHHISKAARHSLDSGLSWFGFHLPAVAEVGVVLALGIVMLSIAAWQFSVVE